MQDQVSKTSHTVLLISLLLCFSSLHTGPLAVGCFQFYMKWLLLEFLAWNTVITQKAQWNSLQTLANKNMPLWEYIIIISSFLKYFKSLQQKDSYKEKVLLNIPKCKKVYLCICVYNLCELIEKIERERWGQRERETERGQKRE